MRDLRQIIRDNGGDNTPAGDSHDLTGRADRLSELKPSELDLFEDIHTWINKDRK